MMTVTKYLPPYHPYQPEQQIPPFDIDQIADEDIDRPANSREVLPIVLDERSQRDVTFPPLILGCAAFGYGMYADDSVVKSSMPLRVIRLAMRYGINAFDTAPWYNPSEITFGHALRALKYKRNQYHIITKVGKYGPNSRDHIWEPEVIRASVERSLKRIGTNYLDAVYLHDIEYSLPSPSYTGNPIPHLQTILSLPLVPTLEEARILGGVATLRNLQTQRVVTLVGMSGYPLPVLLRISLLVLHVTGKPLDVVQTFGHHTLQNNTLESGYLRALTEQAKVGRVVSASPLAMGLLTTGGGPDWHPARDVPKLFDATRDAVDLCQNRGTTLQDISLSFGYRPLYQSPGVRVPIVVGCTNLDQLRDTMRRYKEVNPDADGEGQVSDTKALEEDVRQLFEEKGVQGWSWTCPTHEQRTG